MAKLTLKDVEAIEAREKKATEGPWERNSNSMRDIWGGGRYAPWVEIVSGDGDDNLDFIAHSRSDIPALCAAVREAMGLVEGYFDNMMEPCCCGEPEIVGECMHCAGVRTFEEDIKKAIKRWRGEA